MTGYFKLIDAVTSPQNIAVAKQKKGYVSNTHVRILPGETYDIRYKDANGNFLDPDPVYIESLRGAKVAKRKTDSLEATLKAHNVPYEEILCKSCGGRVAKLQYNIIEVVITDG